MKNLALAGALVFVSINTAASQECTSLAQVISRQTSKVASKDQELIARRAQLCSAHYESATSEQRAQIEASYGLFSGGAGGSSQQIKTLQDQQCSDQYGTYWRDKVASSEINDVSLIGAEVVKACLSQVSFRLVGLTLQDDGISAVYRYNGTGGTKINGISMNPSSMLKDCSVLALGETYTDLSKTVGLSLPSGSTMTLTCTRAGNETSSSDPSIRYQGGVVTVATDSDSPRLPLISYSVPAVPESAAASLRREIAELRDAPAFGFTGSGTTAPTGQDLPVGLASAIFSRGVASVDQNGRFVTVQKPGFYQLSGHVVLGYDKFDETTIHAYKKCEISVRRANGPTEFPLTSFVFDSECNVGGVVQLGVGDQISLVFGNSGESRQIAGAGLSGYFLGSP